MLCNTTNGREEFDGDIFISSMPLKDLILGFKGEKIPKRITEIAKGLPYRDFMTVGVLVNKLKIKNGLYPDKVSWDIVLALDV